MLKDMFIGGIAGIISRTATAPLELYKIQLQSNYLKEASMKNVIQKEGIRYMWKGNSVNCMRVFPQFALNYSIYNKCKTHCSFIKDDKIKNFLCGGISGIVAMATIYPLETVRTRLALQMNKSHYSSPWQVIRKLNINQLYSGLKISLLGFGPFSAFNFMFYNMYLDTMNNYQQLSPEFSKLLAGGSAGITSLTITYPTDLLRRRFQMEGFNSATPRYNGIIDGLKTIAIEDGFIGLYRGLTVAYIRVFPCLAIQFWCLETGKKFLK